MNEAADYRSSHLRTIATRTGILSGGRAGIALVLGVLGVLLLSGFAGGFGPGSGASASPAAPLAVAAVHSAPAAPRAPDRPVVPATGGLTGTFFTNSSNIARQSSANDLCNPASFPNCLDQAQNPSIMTLANGSLGVAFSIVTAYSASTCSFAPGNVTSQVGWATSSDNGSTWGAISYLANDTCPYIQALEPSFAVGGAGVVYGTFVEANATRAQVNQAYGAPLIGYTSRPADALAFTKSTDNGSTFSTVRTLVAGGNISRPALAAFGSTVYIVYENISNGTTLTTYTGTGNSIALYLLYSADGGATWNGPYVVPGQNASEGYSAMSPSIAVSPGGEVAVAYATNRTCIAFCTTFGSAWGDDIVVSTSMTNGTAWSGPYTIARSLGESNEYLATLYLYALFQFAPQTSVAWGSATDLYVAYAGSLNVSSTSGYPQYYDYSETSVFAAVSTTAGTTWATTELSPPLPKGLEYPYGQDYYNPAVAAHNGVPYVTYTYTNESYACGIAVNPYGNYAGSQWLTNYTAGAWNAPTLVMLLPQAYGFWNFAGFTAGITFDTAGRVVPAFSVDAGYVYTGSFTANTFIEVATVYTGPVTSVTVEMTGLTNGTSWNIEIDGEEFVSTTTNLTVTNVPSGPTVYLAWNGPYVFPGYREVLMPLFSRPLTTSFSGPTSFYANFTQFDGITFAPEPLDLSYLYLSVVDYSSSAGYLFNYYYYWETYFGYGGVPYPYQGGCPFPWYVPAGANLRLIPTYNFANGVYGYYTSEGLTAGYWNGTGLGSYTGAGTTANLTVSSPWNETVWFLSYGTYTESFQAPGLPASSTYSFNLDSTGYSGAGGSVVQVGNVSTGPHWLTSIQATSSTSGWQYFGRSDAGNPVLVPLHPVVNLSFAYVEVGASEGTISFHATGLTAGTIWQFAFNGTIYSSSTPWINVTAHPGDYPVGGYPVLAQNGSAGYVPLNLASSMNVTTGQSYAVNFTNAYRVQVVVGAGGTIAPTNTSYWLAPGAQKTITATVLPGYEFIGWSGTGAGAYTGTNLTATVTANGPVVETANFYPLAPDRFSLTFNQSGVPLGTWWTVYLNGVGYSSDQANLTVTGLYSCTFSGSLGRYALAVPYAYDNSTAGLRYVPAAFPAQACGGSAPVSLTYSAQVLVTLGATAGGSASVQSGAAQSSSALWIGANLTATLQATALSGYRFLGWNGTGAGSYTGTAATTTVQPYGPVSEIAVFAALVPPGPPPSYTVTFTLATPLSGGTTWGLTLGSASYSSTGATLNVSGLTAGSYDLTVRTAISADGLTEYQPVAAPPTVAVTRNMTVPLSFSTSYWVTVTAVGPGIVSPHSGWYSARSVLTLNATAGATGLFVAWAGAGAGAYNGTAAQTTLTVVGPVEETATFVPTPAPPATAATSVWESPATIALFALLGIVIGVVVGIVLVRLRRGGSGPGPGAATGPEAEPEVPADAPGPEEAPGEPPMEGGTP